MTNIVDADHYRTKRVAHSTGGSDGGNMDDVLKRLGLLECQVGEVRGEVRAINAILPHLATKADISALEARTLRWMVGTMIAIASVAFTIAKFVN